MKYNLKRITEFNKMVIDAYCTSESIAVDATCGNGHDTLYLAERCKFVYGFDIQEQALTNTQSRLRENERKNCRLFNASFSQMDKLIDERADIITFNLGYLPGGDKNITTLADETVEGIKAALRLLNEHGLISITMYWGHPQGKYERQRVLEYCRTLDGRKYHVTYLSLLNQDNCPPEIILINN